MRNLLGGIIIALLVGFGAGYWTHGLIGRNSTRTGAAALPSFEKSAYVGGPLKNIASDSLQLESIPDQYIKITSETKFWKGTPDSTFEFSELELGDNLMIMLKEPFNSKRQNVAVSVELQGHVSEGGPVTDGAVPPPEGDPSKDPANTKAPATVSAPAATPPPASKTSPPPPADKL